MVDHIATIVIYENYLPLTSSTSAFPAFNGHRKGQKDRAKENHLGKGRVRYAINFSVTDAGGSVKTYHLEVSDTVGKPQNLPFKVSEQAAALAAVHWVTGFYGASSVTAYTVDWKTAHKNGTPLPYPYYLINMTGKVGDTTQPLYAAVLENGELVRPVETTSIQRRR
jgi:hypothetical protein